MEMTREQFIELFDLKETDEEIDVELVLADRMHEEGMSWFEIAKLTVATVYDLLTSYQNKLTKVEGFGSPLEVV